MPRPRRNEHGPIVNGRLQFDRDVYEIIRTYVRYKHAQAVAELERLKAVWNRNPIKMNIHAMDQAAAVEAHIRGLMATGVHSVDPVLWAEQWRIVTTDERHKGTNKEPETQTIPGME